MPSLFHLDHLHIMMFLHRYLGSFQGNPKNVLACHSWVKSIEKIEHFIVDDVLPLLAPCLKSSSLTASLSRVSPSQATCRQSIGHALRTIQTLQTCIFQNEETSALESSLQTAGDPQGNEKVHTLMHFTSLRCHEHIV